MYFLEIKIEITLKMGGIGVVPVNMQLQFLLSFHKKISSHC